MAAWVGASIAWSPTAAAFGAVALALLSGWWRHLSADYGPVLGVDSALLYLLALDGPAHGATPAQIATWTSCGDVRRR